MRRPSLVLVTAVALAASARPSGAVGPVDATLGVDYYRGPNAQTTWRPMGELEATVDSFTANVNVSHFDDNQTGQAWGVTGTLKIPLAQQLKLVTAGTGFAGDSTHGAWRAKLGPEFELGAERTLLVYAARYQDQLGNTANAIGTDYDTPLVPKLSGSAALAVQRSNNLTGGDATLTLGWTPHDAFEVTGDLGASLNASGLTGLLPPRGLLLKQSGRGAGSKPNGTTASSASMTALIGIRLHF